MDDHRGNICKKAGAKLKALTSIRDGSRTAATSKVGHFVIIVNGWKSLAIMSKHSILGVAAVLDPPLRVATYMNIEKMYLIINAFFRHNLIIVPLLGYSTTAVKS